MKRSMTEDRGLGLICILRFVACRVIKSPPHQALADSKYKYKFKMPFFQSADIHVYESHKMGGLRERWRVLESNSSSQQSPPFVWCFQFSERTKRCQEFVPKAKMCAAVIQTSLKNSKVQRSWIIQNGGIDRVAAVE